MYPAPKGKDMSLVHSSINRWHMNDDEIEGDKGVSGPNAMGTWMVVTREVHILGI